ncbi:MAG: hypothetical protein WCA06_22590, partial [Terrimicrobiaceae bacterium]
MPTTIDPKPMTGGSIQFAGLARASLPMIVSKARLGARRVTTSPCERAIGLARKDPDFPHQVAERHDNEDRRDNLKQKVDCAITIAAVFPEPQLAEDQNAYHHGRDDACKIGNQARGYRVTGASDRDGAEINRDHVKRRLG